MTDEGDLFRGEVPRLLGELVDELERGGLLRSAEWRQAVERVPRHLFLPEFYTDATGGDGLTRYSLVSQRVDSEEWLKLVYQNNTWVTQLDHGHTTWDGAPVLGVPTSSSTLPGVVVRMLEELNVGDRMRVLEVGTGTGYSTALLCQRLGDQYVTSVEHDARLSKVAGDRLYQLLSVPNLVVGDGAEGWSHGAPYDRIIATYSPARIPPAWLTQAAPGAVILASVVGSLDAYGYARLNVLSDSEARGWFIDGDVSFMSSREERRPDVGPLIRAALEARQGARGVKSAVTPGMLAEQSLMWAVQIELPGAVRVGLNGDGGVSGHWFLHPDGSWAVLESHPDGTARAYQGGPRAMWTTVEASASRWLDKGRPGLERYGLTVTSDENTVWLDDPSHRVGVLGGS